MSRLLPAKRRTRVILTFLGVAVVAVGLGLAAYFSPLMSVRSTEVRDNRTVSGEEILGKANIASGTPLLQVDTAAVARRVAEIPSVESVRVQRDYPSTLSITIVERVPVAIVEEGDKIHVLDRSGVGYLTYDKASAPPAVAKLPVFSTANAGPSDPTTKAALGVVAELPEPLSGQVERVTATSPVDIEFTLKGGRTVVWGDSSQGPEKARTLGYLLTRRGTVYNVSSPEFPAYR